MALTRVIDKAAYDKLPAQLKTEYKAEGESFVLDLTDYEDPKELKAAKDREVEARKKAAADLKTANEALETMTSARDELLKSGVPKGNLEALETSYKEKMATAEKGFKTSIKTLTGQIHSMLVDNVAQGLAVKISNSPKLLVPHIAQRLKAEHNEESGTWTTRVLDANGKPSALTVDDLAKEFSLNPDFKAIMTGSRASGGGAGSGQSGGGAGTFQKANDLNKASPSAIVSHMRATGHAPQVDV